jgi:hypothetical protein
MRFQRLRKTPLRLEASPVGVRWTLLQVPFTEGLVLPQAGLLGLH